MRTFRSATAVTAGMTFALTVTCVATTTVNASAKPKRTIVSGEGPCTDIFEGGGTTQVPGAYVPVYQGHLYFQEDLGDPANPPVTPVPTCIGSDYTLTAYSPSGVLLGSQTIAGDGVITRLHFDVNVGLPTVTSVCVVGTNGATGTTVPVPATETSTVERAPTNGCLSVADGVTPGSTFH
ncbi:MAG: hypothetical protein NVS3B26_00050 [Mycobacteriales bacterium]